MHDRGVVLNAGWVEKDGRGWEGWEGDGKGMGGRWKGDRKGDGGIRDERQVRVTGGGVTVGQV